MWWLLASALAAPPPDLVVDDPILWQDASSKVLDGPPGCWEVVGRVSWTWDVGRFGLSHGSSVFAARLEDGIWRDIYIRSLGEDQQSRLEPVRRVFPHGEQRFLPLVGRARIQRITDEEGNTIEFADASPPPVSPLNSVFERLGTDVEYSSVTWNEERHAVVLERRIPLQRAGSDPDAVMRVSFPSGGLAPDYLDVVFPAAFSSGGFPSVRYQDAYAAVDARLVDGMTFPEGETFRFQASVLGFHVDAAQTIDYRSFNRCAAP